MCVKINWLNSLQMTLEALVSGEESYNAFSLWILLTEKQKVMWLVELLGLLFFLLMETVSVQASSCDRCELVEAWTL